MMTVAEGVGRVKAQASSWLGLPGGASLAIIIVLSMLFFLLGSLGGVKSEGLFSRRNVSSFDRAFAALSFREPRNERASRLGGKRPRG